MPSSIRPVKRAEARVPFSSRMGQPEISQPQGGWKPSRKNYSS
jgi:hypothetical protein